MSSQPLNLVERAAQRLREAGSLDPSAAQLLEIDRRAEPPPAAAIAPVPPVPPVARRPSTRFIDSTVIEAAGAIDWSQGRSRISEEFRIVQGHILRAAFTASSGGEGLANLVMITSARPGEGKSFAALNLALSIGRQRDHEVLLVDTDPTAQSLGRALGLLDAPGLLDLALDPHLDPDVAIARTGAGNLSVLPIGTRPKESAELFATRRMARRIRDLGQRYADRIVILDAAPCLSSSDPATLAPVVGQIVLVVEAERTQRAEVEAALDLLQVCPTISLLLNKVQVTTSHTFGAYATVSASP